MEHKIDTSEERWKILEEIRYNEEMAKKVQAISNAIKNDENFPHTLRVFLKDLIKGCRDVCDSYAIQDEIEATFGSDFLNEVLQ